MSKNQVIVTKGNKTETTVKALGQGQPVVLKAEPGTRFELQDLAQGKKTAVQGAKFQRVGKNLQIVLDGEDTASLVIEDYYSIYPEGFHAVTGQAESGALYEYVTPIGSLSALQADAPAVVASLGNQAISMAEAPVGLRGLTPLAGLLGAGVAASVAANQGEKASGELIIKGQVSAGPVHAGITVYAYDDQGQLLGKAEVDSQGQWRIKAEGRADYKGAVLVVAVDSNEGASNYKDEVTAAEKSMDTNLRVMAVQGESNVSNTDGVRVLTVNVTPVTELAVRQAGVTTTKAPAPAVVTETNTQVAKALGVADLDITGAVTTTISSDFKAGDGLNSAEKYGLLLTKLSGLDKANNGSIDASLKQLADKLQNTSESQALLEQGRLQALQAVQSNVAGAVFTENNDLNRQLLGEVLIQEQRLDENGHLVIKGTALPGSTVTVTTATGTQQVQVDAQGQFSLTTTQAQSKFDEPLRVQTQDGMGQDANSSIALKPVVDHADALTPESIATLSAAQVDGLTPQAISNMTAQEVGALKPEAFAALSPEQLAALNLGNIAGLTRQTILALSQEQMDALSPEVFSVLSELAAPIITSADLAAMSPAQLFALTRLEVSRLTDDVVASLTAAQIAALSPAGFSGLSVTDLAALSSSAVGGITAAQVPGLDANEIAALGTDIANLGSGAMGALSPAQFAALSPEQLAAFSREDIAALSDEVVASITGQQIAVLSPDAVTGLSASDLSLLSADAVAALSPAQIAALGTDIANLSSAGMGALSPAQFAALSAAQLAALGSEDVAALSNAVVDSLTAAQVAALSPAGFSGFSTSDLNALSNAAVGGITAAQVPGLDPSEIAALGTDIANLGSAAMGRLTPAQFAAFTPAQLAALGSDDVAALNDDVIDSMTSAQLAALNTAAFAGLSTADLDALSSAAVAGMTAAQVASLDEADILALGTDIANIGSAAMGALTPEQFAALTPAQIAALSGDDVAALSDDVIDSLTATQVAALSTAGITGLSTIDLAALGSSAVQGLTAEHIATFDDNEIEALGTDIANLSSIAMGALTPDQFAALTPAQLAALGSEDLAALSDDVIESLTETQVAALSAAGFSGLSSADLGLLTGQAVSGITVKAGPDQTVSFSSMTKDSGVAGSNADWLTNDGSAGRLVSGTLSAPLEEGQTLQVFVNGDVVGEAAVSGTYWQITDTAGYSGNWTYTAYVVDAKGRTGPEASRVVTNDVTAEAAPVITVVTDSALAAIADDGTTNNSLKRVSGTGVTGNTIYLYDNTVTNLVGTATVVNGEWSVSVSGLFNVAGGSNAFSAVQMDAAGNTSVMSNLWTVNAGANLVPNGDFISNTNFTSSLSLLNGAVNPFTGVGPAGYYLYPVPPAPDGSTVQPLTTSATSTGTAENGSGLSWSTKTLTILRDANLSTQDSNNYAATKASVMGTDTAMAVTVRGDQNLGLITVYQVPTNTVAVEAGKTYQFSFNYEVNPWRTKTLTAVVDGVEMKVTGYEGPLNYFTMGTMKATYTATETKTIDIQFLVNNNGATGGVGGELWLDDISFKIVTTPADGSLVAGEHMGGTPAVDNLSYGGGFVNAQGGDDVITVTGTDLQSRLLAGGLIQGGEGYDTLVLAAGTSLNMMSLRAVQTVESLQQLEAITLQGNSNLTLNANDVLSLGGEVVGSKVRLVINKTSTDQVTLDNLDLNPGHEGTWVSSGTTTLNGYAYNVLNHSTTQAQVLLQTNAAPVLLTGSTLAYTENDAAKVINSAITLADVDNATFASATVSITGGYVAGQDVLSFTNVSMGNIIGSYANGVMTLTSENGTATQAQWQAALQAVAYSNTSDAPSTAARTVSYVINDGQLDSTPVTSTVNLTTLNDAPVIDVATTVNLNSVLKDAAAPLNGNTTAGTLVGTLLGAITDPDGDVPKGILVTGAGAGYQSLYFSTNGGTTWIQLTNLTTSNAVFLDANSRIFYKPVAGTTGFRDGAVWYRAWDITDGVTAGTFINLTTASTGGSSSISDSSVYGAMGVNIITNTLPTGSVSITGTLEQGSTLTVTNSLADVNGLGPIAYSWFVNGVSTGIVGDAYVLAAGDAGKAITVKASYTDLQGTQESMLSAPVEFVTAGQAVVNLGASYGTLTLPNQIDGRWYYYWNSASGNGGWDRGYNNFVEGLFNEDVNGNVKPAGIEGPNDIYRYATINGVRLALPTAGIQTDENGYVQAGGLNNAGTAVNSGATYNSKYSDMLAVWDAYNGTETDTVNWATAHPSTANNVRYYWTATPVSVTGTPNGQHVMLDFLTGDAASRADNLIFNVMVEVLSPQAGLAMPVITLASGQGKLINPVEVEGKWYYSWDRNGNGVLTGYNYDPDYFNAGELNTLFNKDIFGNTNTVGADMNEVFRYTTLKDANGADVWMAVPTYGGMVNANGYANVVDWQNQQANVGANTSVNAYGTINTVYDDFAAIFDAGGVPPLGWTNTYYKTASVYMVNGAVWTDKHLGYLNGDFYTIMDLNTNSGAFALEMVKPNLAPVLADTALSFGTASASSLPVGAVGVLVSDLMGGVTDGDAGASKGVAIIDIQYGGTLWYSTNGGANWLMSKDVTAQKALLLGADADNRIFFQPGKNMTGTVNDAITFRAWDRSRGEEGQFLGNNTTVNGGASPFSAATETLSVNVGTPPVVLDLNRDGSLSYSHVAMDVNGDGRLDHTAWAGAQDGVLVWDKNGDGVVRDASQYAFTQYGGQTDLQGLAAGFDSNHDGVFDAADAKFAEFAVWQDANQNGVSEAGEVRSLADVGVASIHLSSDGVTSTPADGVSEAGRTTAITTDGSSMLVADAAFEFSALSYRVNAEGDLSLLGEQMSLDLSSLVAAHGALHSVDLSGTGANSLKISLSDLMSLGEQQPLRVLGDADDSVELDAAQWTASGSAQAEGHSYAVYAASNGQQLWLDQQIHMA